MNGVEDFRRRALIATAVLMIGFALFMFALPKPDLPPPNLLNGRYQNPCCESFEVVNGRIILGQQSHAFELGFDKTGLYAVPERYFGVEKGRRVIFADGHPLKLRIDSEKRPSTIELWDRSGGKPYSFVRTP
jgi:hypothetical protein